MRPLRYQGEIRQEGAEYEVRITLALPSEADARAVAQWLHEAIRHKVESSGGRLTPILGAKPLPRFIAKAGLR